ncbi:MAG: L,D-transpeptidase family protein [Acidiferrobacterales bacterium]
MRLFFPSFFLAIGVLLAPAAYGQTGFTEALRTQFTAKRPGGIRLLDPSQLQAFYQEHDFHPVWITHDAPNYHAWLLRKALRSADREGLDPTAYRLPAIERQWTETSLDSQVKLELLLSDAYMRYSRQLRAGRLNPADIDPDWHIQPKNKTSAPLAWLTMDADDFDRALDTLPPPQPGYQRLRKALAHYRQIKHDGGWPTLGPGPALKLGAYDRRVALLRIRLMAEGDLKSGAFENLDSYNLPVRDAVERFQQRHGIKPDGVVGPVTRAAMNIPVERRIEEIKLNMERWRWLPRQLGDRYVMVNTAGYTLDVVDHDRTALSMRVITGQKDKTTPVLAARLSVVQLNPYWRVPDEIAAEELLPKQQQNPNYLAEHHYRVFDRWGEGAKELDPGKINWRKYNKDNFPYKLRQDPGPHNALGLIKFIFQNKLAIYLHDTPQRQLFAKTDRAFSHGCVRVQQPMSLALNLLQDQPQWDREFINENIESGATVDVRLTQQVPIYLVYWTAWVGDDGQTNFRADVYERDRLAEQNGHSGTDAPKTPIKPAN